MLVTIFADASFCHRTQAGGWGAWAISERGKIMHGGQLKFACGTATECEMAAIVNAVAMARKAGVAAAGDTLLIESDCIAAMEMLERRHAGPAQRARGKRKKRARRVLIIEGFVKVTAECRLRFKHVKAHQGGTNPRSYINEQCDGTAYFHMNKARAARRPKKGEAHEAKASTAEG